MNEQLHKPILSSEVRCLCQGFIELQRAVGKKYVKEEKELRRFWKYCEQVFPDSSIPQDIICTWVMNEPNRSMKTRSTLAGTLTMWAKYAFSLGYIPMVLPHVRGTVDARFIPYIFTTDEMQRIWNAVDHIEPQKLSPNLHKCIPVLFRLLFSSGLRISEALQITVRDVDFAQNTITLYRTKNDWERLIPMSGSLAAVMKTYINECCCALTSESPIFYHRKGNLLTPHSVYCRFRMVLHDSNIPYQGKLRGPRLHDFRHTFAVHAMNKLVDEGHDIYVILPVLSAYLGHSNVRSTERYIRLTEERLTKVTDSMEIMIPNLFPEVKDDAEI
jgi:integrase